MPARVDETGIVEVATIGNEGMVGLPLFLGAELSPQTMISQVPGDLLRMSAEGFQKAAAKSSRNKQSLYETFASIYPSFDGSNFTGERM